MSNDHLEAGIFPGGSALYASLVAAHLGLSARAVTSHGPDFVGLEALAAAGVTVEGAGRTTTTFDERFQGGHRSQRVLAVAEPLTVPVEADIVFACPIVDEVAASVLVGPLVGAGLQGWFRRLAGGGVVERRVPDDLGFLAPCRAVFVSLEDLGAAAPAVLPRLRAVVPIVVVTDGRRGATVHAGGDSLHVPVFPAREVDPTGAGDVFAAAFLVALFRGEALATAGRFAAAAASIVIEGMGPSALSRLGEAAARAAALPR